MIATTVFIHAMELGVQTMLAWQEYQQALLDRQKRREAEGTQLTQADVDQLLAATHNRLASNKTALEAAMAAQEASRRQ